MTYYWSTIVSIALSCTTTNIPFAIFLALNNIMTFKSRLNFKVIENGTIQAAIGIP